MRVVSWIPPEDSAGDWVAIRMSKHSNSTWKRTFLQSELSGNERDWLLTYLSPRAGCEGFITRAFAKGVKVFFWTPFPPSLTGQADSLRRKAFLVNPTYSLPSWEPLSLDNLNSTLSFSAGSLAETIKKSSCKILILLALQSIVVTVLVILLMAVMAIVVVPLLVATDITKLLSWVLVFIPGLKCSSVCS